MHKLATKLPIILVFFWLLCAFFDYEPRIKFCLVTDIYRILLVLIFLHFAKFTDRYSEFEKLYVYCIFSIVFFHAFMKITHLLDYMKLYYFINIFFIIFSIWTLTTTRKKKN